jgi:hypothetical protein
VTGRQGIAGRIAQKIAVYRPLKNGTTTFGRLGTTIDTPRLVAKPSASTAPQGVKPLFIKSPVVYHQHPIFTVQSYRFSTNAMERDG